MDASSSQDCGQICLTHSGFLHIVVGKRHNHVAAATDTLPAVWLSAPLVTVTHLSWTTSCSRELCCPCWHAPLPYRYCVYHCTRPHCHFTRPHCHCTRPHCHCTDSQRNLTRPCLPLTSLYCVKQRLSHTAEVFLIAVVVCCKLLYVIVK